MFVLASAAFTVSAGLVGTVLRGWVRLHLRDSHSAVCSQALCHSCLQRPPQFRLGWWAQSLVAGSGWHLSDSHCLQAGFLLARPVASSVPQIRTVLGWASVHSRGWAYAHLNHACSLCVPLQSRLGRRGQSLAGHISHSVWLEDCIARCCWFAWVCVL